MAKIKKGDLVQVISGAKPERGGDRGKQGKVTIDEAAFHDDLPGLMKAAMANSMGLLAHARSWKARQRVVRFEVVWQQTSTDDPPATVEDIANLRKI